jgi:hypothetical protein
VVFQVEQGRQFFLREFVNTDTHVMRQNEIQKHLLLRIEAATDSDPAFLIDLLSYYGFKETEKMNNGEIRFEKSILTGALPLLTAGTLDFDREHYPRFHDGPTVRKFCVPIKAGYHRQLFPEIAFGSELPLFPTETFATILPRGQERTPGNPRVDKLWIRARCAKAATDGSMITVAVAGAGLLRATAATLGHARCTVPSNTARWRLRN